MPSDFPTKEQLNQQTEMLKRISQAKYANVGNQMINSNFPSGMGLNPQEQMPAQEQVNNAPQRSRSVIPLENVMDSEPPPAGLSQYGGARQPSFGGISPLSVDRPKMSESELKDMVRRQQAMSPSGGLPVTKIPAMAPLMLESESGVSVRATPMSGGKYKQIEAGVTVPFAGGDLSIDGSYGRVYGKYKDKPEISRHIEYVRRFAEGGPVNTEDQISGLMANGGLAVTAMAKGGEVSPLSGGMNIRHRMRDEFAKRGLDFDGFLSTKAEARAAAEKLKSMGNDGDTILAHINPREAALLKEHGGSGTINPKTGLLQFSDTEGSPGGDATGGTGGGVGGSNGSSTEGSPGNDASGGTGGGVGSGGSQGSGSSTEGSPGNDATGGTGGGIGGGNTGGSPAGDASGGFGGGIGGGPGSTQDADAPSSNAKEASFDTGIPGFDGILGALSPVGVTLGTEEMGPANPNAVTNPTAAQVTDALNSLAAALSTQAAKETAISNNLAGLVEAPAALGVSPSTAAVASSPSTSTKSNDVSTTATNATADSSTTKGKSYDITGISLIDNAITNAINNPAATAIGLGASLLGGPVLGALNTVTGNPIGNIAANALGIGNTQTSQTNPTNQNPTNQNPTTPNSFEGLYENPSLSTEQTSVAQRNAPYESALSPSTTASNLAQQQEQTLPIGFSREYVGVPSNMENYGYGSQHSFYAARGGVVSPLNQLRKK